MDEKKTSPNPYAVKTLLSWKAPGRPYKKRTRGYFTSMLLLTVLIEVILFLFSQYALMAVVGSLVFLSLALAFTPPSNFQYRISTEGIMVEDHFFLWEELYDFYFKKRNGIDVLHIRTYAMIPGELTLTLGDLTEQHVKQALLPYLPYREYVKPTMMEKSADWLSKNFPLEKE
ncbi:MAG TPA: hypothetical protein VLB73_04555 [Patescibacteria group bacterium]|nr:hypothetical protein [Patescibacteria group bacterium]